MLKRRTIDQVLSEPTVHKWDDDARATFKSEVIRSRRFGRTVGLVVVDAAEKVFTTSAVGAMIDAVRRYDHVIVDPKHGHVAVVAPEATFDEVAVLADRLACALGAVGQRVQVRVAVAPDHGVELDEVASAALAPPPRLRLAWQEAEAANQ